LSLKAMVLRTLQKKQECVDCLTEVINAQNLLRDKLYYCLALIEMGKVYAKESPQQAAKYFDDAMKLSGFAWEMSVKQRARVHMKAIGVEEEDVVIDEKEEQKLLESEEIKQLIKAEEQEEDNNT